MAVESISAALATQGKAADASTQLNQNLDTFLKLLTSQLKNQDPLKPMDSNEFTQQLVQFSSVEQSIQSNKNLENLILLQKASTSSTAVGYIGREISAVSNKAPLQNGSATWRYALTQAADAVTLTISDSSGKVILSKQGDKTVGSHDFVWDGKDAYGTAQPEGVYSVQVAARTAAGDPITTSTSMAGTVSGVSFAEDDPSLVVNGVQVKLSDVLTVKNSATTTN